MPTRNLSIDIHPRFLREKGHAVASDSERLILDLVRKAGVMPRADLIRACGFSGPGAKGLIDGLVDRGMLQLGAPTSKGRGQPSATVSLVPHYAYCIGLSITVDGYSLTLMDFAGNTIGERFERAFPLQLEQVRTGTQRGIQDMCSECGISPEAIFGVGLSMTGPFVGSGSRVNPPLSMPEAWASTELDRYFAEHLGQPVWMDNDANCAATAESLFGVGRTSRSFVYLHFTDGFGGGVVQAGKIVRGSHGNAGEFGRLLAHTDLQSPTLESLRERLVTVGHQLPDLHTMLSRYDPTWPQIDEWVTRVRGGLTLVVAAITALFDPELIVLGARLPRDLAERLCASVGFETHPRRQMHAPHPQLVHATIGQNAAGLGAATLPFKEHFFL